jgi:hypothetical protein
MSTDAKYCKAAIRYELGDHCSNDFVEGTIAQPIEIGDHHSTLLSNYSTASYAIV